MKIALFIPPLGCMTHPYLSLPSLTGFLRSIGHEVFQYDVGMRTLDEMFTSTYLQGRYRSILRKIEELRSSDEMTEQQEKHLQYLLSADLYAPDVVENIERAKTILRSGDLFYQAPKYIFASNIIHRALDMVSADCFPTKVTYKDVFYLETMNFDNIYALAFNESRHPFLEIMRDVVLPEVLREIPPVVGISITYYSQLVSGFALARLIKSLSPATHIVIGGATVTLAEKRIREDKKAFEWVDSYVFGEGESALAKLVEIIGSDFSIPNDLDKLYLKSELGSVQSRGATTSNRYEREKFNELPPPDYSGLNLDDFLSPETVFLISNGRGCYWGKCNFCNVSLAFKNKFQQRSLEVLRRDIQLLQKKHGARLLFFSDDCVPPKRCGEISRLSLEQDSPFCWQAEIRYEKEFTKELLQQMHRGGCRQLIIGNESGNQRILDLMRKNTNVERNKQILRDAGETGIAVNLHNFVGFPCETIEEANDTIDFLVSNRDNITSVTMNTFELQEYSPVHQNPEAFGVTEMESYDASEFLPYFTFSTDAGATREEVERIYELAWTRLGRAYPCQNYFLDHTYGVHVFLFMVFYGERKIEDIFLNLPEENLFKKRLRLKTSMKSRQIGQGVTIVFNPENGYLATLDVLGTKWLNLADGTMSLKESCVKLYKAGLKNGSEETIDKITALIFFTAHDLYQAGFIDLD